MPLTLCSLTVDQGSRIRAETGPSVPSQHHIGLPGHRTSNSVRTAAYQSQARASAVAGSPHPSLGTVYAACY